MIKQWFNTSDGTPDYRRLTLAYLGVWFLFRLWFCQAFELVGDEAYYWLWSKHLDWNYYSKGPGVALFIAAGTRLFGDTEFGVRFPSVLLSLLTGLLWFRLATRLFNARTGFWTLVVASFTPLFIAGSALMTIDPISVFFWVLAAQVFWDIKDRSSGWPWFGLGLIVAMGTLGKYTNIAQIPCFLLFLLWDRSYRPVARSYRFLYLLLGFSLCLIPILGWNAQHDWITFTHLKERGAVDQAFRFSWSEWAGFWTGQLLVMTPFYFIGLAMSFFSSLRKRQAQTFRYLMSLFAPLFLFYVLLGVNDSGQPNWTVPALIAGLLWMTAVWLEWTRQYTAARWAVRVSLTVLALLCITAHVLALVRLPLEKDPLRRLRGSRDLGHTIEQWQERHEADFVIGAHYQISSLIAFYHPDRPRTYVPHSRVIENQYYFWPTYGEAQSGKNALFVNKTDFIEPVLKQEFERIEPLGTLTTTFQGRPEYTFYIYRCHRYLGQALNDEHTP